MPTDHGRGIFLWLVLLNIWNYTHVHQKTKKTVKLFRVGVTPWLVEGRFLGPNSICIIICVSTQHAYQARGKKQLKKSPLDAETCRCQHGSCSPQCRHQVDEQGWRGAGGSLSPSPACCSLGLCNCVSVTKLKLKCKNTCAMAFLFYKRRKKRV